MNVDRTEFLRRLEETLNAAPQTIREDDLLENLEGWDSIAVISVMATAEYAYGATLDPLKFAKCQTVGELIRLVEESST